MTDLTKYREPLVEMLTTHKHPVGTLAIGPNDKPCDYCAAFYGDLVDKVLASPVLAQIKADAVAAALREATDEIEQRIEPVSDSDVDSGGFETGMEVGCEIAYTEAARRLRERADRAEASGEAAS